MLTRDSYRAFSLEHWGQFQLLREVLLGIGKPQRGAPADVQIAPPEESFRKILVSKHNKAWVNPKRNHMKIGPPGCLVKKDVPRDHRSSFSF